MTTLHHPQPYHTSIARPSITGSSAPPRTAYPGTQTSTRPSFRGAPCREGRQPRTLVVGEADVDARAPGAAFHAPLSEASVAWPMHSGHGNLSVS